MIQPFIFLFSALIFPFALLHYVVFWILIFASDLAIFIARQITVVMENKKK
jgi:hypothetical protein